MPLYRENEKGQDFMKAFYLTEGEKGMTTLTNASTTTHQPRPLSFCFCVNRLRLVGNTQINVIAKTCSAVESVHIHTRLDSPNNNTFYTSLFPLLALSSTSQIYFSIAFAFVSSCVWRRLGFSASMYKWKRNNQNVLPLWHAYVRKANILFVCPFACLYNNRFPRWS